MNNAKENHQSVLKNPEFLIFLIFESVDIFVINTSWVLCFYM